MIYCAVVNLCRDPAIASDSIKWLIGYFRNQLSVDYLNSSWMQQWHRDNRIIERFTVQARKDCFGILGRQLSRLVWRREWAYPFVCYRKPHTLLCRWLLWSQVPCIHVTLCGWHGKCDRNFVWRRTDVLHCNVMKCLCIVHPIDIIMIRSTKCIITDKNLICISTFAPN